MALRLPEAPGDGPVAIAFSGGMDSTVLLHLASADAGLRTRGLRALHVNHGLHADAAQWARQCAAHCAALDVPFADLPVQVSPGGEGLEAAARAARYAALLQAQRPGELVALAHHRDDQAETVLLRLLRGAGDGLAAMRPLRAFGTGSLWRPLLDVPRDALRDYAVHHGLHWIDDPSNQSDRHDRNYLRHHVMPRLAERWPAASGALARSAALLATQADLLAAEDARRLAQVQAGDPGTLSVPGLLAEPPAWRDRLIRAWLAALDLPSLPTDALATVATELLPARPDARAEFAWSGAVIHRWRDHLHASFALAPLPPDWTVTWDGRAPLALPTGGQLWLEPAAPFDAPVRACARQGGERLRLPGRDHHTELKTLLQSLGVPPWRRARLPLLFAADGELLAAGDVAISARLEAWLSQGGRQLRHHAGD